MVYAAAARKTGAFMLFSLVLAVSLLMFFSGDLNATGYAIKNTGDIAADSGSWVLFLLGVLVGALAVGGFVYVMHIEGKRDE
jgi:hypothetical protein